MALAVQWGLVVQEDLGALAAQQCQADLENLEIRTVLGDLEDLVDLEVLVDQEDPVDRVFQKYQEIRGVSK